MTTKQELVATIRRGFTFEGAPPICDRCSDPGGWCQLHNDCMCEEIDDNGLDCHARRSRFIEDQRTSAAAALDELAAFERVASLASCSHAVIRLQQAVQEAGGKVVSIEVDKRAIDTMTRELHLRIIDATPVSEMVFMSAHVFCREPE